MSTNADGAQLTGVKKRQQIAGTRKEVLMWVAIASAVVVICLVIGMNIFQRIQYQMKVNTEISKTAKTMEANVEAIDGLIKNVNDLRANRLLTAPGLKADDSTVFQVVIDALPTENDSVSLSSSLQNKILNRSGVTIEQISVDGESSSSSNDDDEVTTSNVESPVAQPINFRISIVGTYESIKQTLADIERTIRPIIINSLEISGTDDRLTATIQATTYYSSSVNFQVGEKEVPYDDNTRTTTGDTTDEEV